MLTGWLLRYGYAMVFAAAAVEGDGTLLTATYLAHRGYLRLDGVMLSAAAATVAINQVYYRAGRRFGRARLDGGGRPRLVDRVLSLLHRHRLPIVLTSRFIYGCRVAIPAACGAIGMPAVLFTLVDIAGAVLWTVVLGLGGYGLGHLLSLVIRDLRTYEWVVAAVLLVAAIGVLGRWHEHLPWKRRRGGA